MLKKFNGGESLENSAKSFLADVDLCLCKFSGFGGDYKLHAFNNASRYIESEQRF